MKSALIVSSSPGMVQDITQALKSDFSVAPAPDIAEALRYLNRKRIDILFLDAQLVADGGSVAAVRAKLQPFWNRYPTLEIVMLSQREKIRDAVMAVKAGACDYLTFPFLADEIRLVVNSLNVSAIRDSELEYLREQQWQAGAPEIVTSRNPAMNQVLQKIRSVAPTGTTVLLTGETGVGKGVLAKLIHQKSRREGSQFISVHCGAIPEGLVESELFGHEKGAFTGALRKKLGKFEIAREGTIFLDEIGTVSPVVQIKLLQVLQDGTFSRVGGESVLETSARVVAATNADLKEMSDGGAFRKDLFYRLSVFPVHIPPLRERPEDIPDFIHHFLEKLNLRNQKGIEGIHPTVMDALAAYSWPGNIRELENLIERAYILERSGVLTPQSFPAELFDAGSFPILPVSDMLPLADARRRAISAFEKQYVLKLIARNRGRINRSAEEAGISTRQLHKLMNRYGIRKEGFK